MIELSPATEKCLARDWELGIGDGELGVEIVVDRNKWERLVEGTGIGNWELGMRNYKYGIGN